MPLSVPFGSAKFPPRVHGTLVSLYLSFFHADKKGHIILLDRDERVSRCVSATETETEIVLSEYFRNFSRDRRAIASGHFFFLLADIRDGSMTVMTRSAPCRFLVLLLLLSLTSLCDVNAYPKSDLPIQDRDDFEQELAKGGSSRSFVTAQPTDENDLAPRREKALQKIQEVIVIIPRLTVPNVTRINDKRERCTHRDSAR